jgi:hypothetical protein
MAAGYAAGAIYQGYSTPSVNGSIDNIRRFVMYVGANLYAVRESSPLYHMNNIINWSLVSVAMHLNPSTNKVGHFFRGDNHYCYTGTPDFLFYIRDPHNQDLDKMD